jgi:hypothetical protein
MSVKSVKVVSACVLFIVFNCLLTWTQLKDVFISSDDKAATLQAYSDLVYILSNVSSLPPPTPVSTTCLPPPLPSRPNCSGQPGLSGQIMEQPRRLGLMILFGFEVDTLEIALREQLQLVEKVFLVESTKTHKGVSFFSSSNVFTNSKYRWQSLYYGND